MSETEIQIRLRNSMDKLTPEQAEFIKVRPFCESDAEAAKKVGKASTTISRWKHDAEFIRAYTIATEMIGSKKELVIADQNKQAIVKAQMAALMHVLPDVVQKLITIAMDGRSEEMKLRAIKLLFDTVGLGPQSEMPLNKQSKAFLSIAEMLAPQAKANLDKTMEAPEKTLEELVMEGVSTVMESVDTKGVAEDMLFEEDGVIDEE